MGGGIISGSWNIGPRKEGGVMAKWILLFLRWGHLLAGITWIGILYFYNLANAKFLNFAQSNFMGGVDPQVKLKIYPPLLTKTLWWFRWGALWTVVFGLAMYAIYIRHYMSTPGTHTALGIVGALLFVIYILNFVALGLTADDKNKPIHNLMIFFVLVLCVFAFVAPYTMQANSYATFITIGGGFGILMLLNVWGIIWRNQKKIIQSHLDQANGKPALPELPKLVKVAGVASRTNFWLSIPMLLFMAAPSHLPLP